MATFVLVHGGWVGGWCWKRVAARLRQAGHEVFTPTLTGLGERAHLLHEGIDLTTHIQDVVGVLQWEELVDVVLCGHSYGGMVITGVADTAPERLRTLVYLDAFLPADGQSLMDLVGPERAASFRDSARTKGAGFRVAPLPAEGFGVNRQDRAWIDRQCVDHPLRSLEQKLSLTGAWGKVPKRVYVYATGWTPSAFTQFYERVRHDPAWQTATVPCGHAVMVDMPQELTQMLMDAGQ
ncbi:MAG: alpha/beta hydrolase [Deltaproteobacteria bacterium]|nr:alpha/beta hydrolase [Deltaproteobacteria bacterium]